MAEALPEYPDSDFSDDDQTPLDISFNKAAEYVKKLTNKLDNNQLLQLYSLFKQGTVGKCNTPKPSWLDGKNRRKWEAWKSLDDLPSIDAKEQYVALVQKYAPELTVALGNEAGIKESWVAVSSLCKTDEPDLVYNELSILDAARENCSDRVAELLAKRPELRHEKDEDGLTALHWAADRNATAALQAALDGGCPVDAVDESGQTALHYAASCGHIESAQILLRAGASLLKDEDDSSPLDVAADEEMKMVLGGAK